MTRYLLATWEGGGVVPPELELAKRLVVRGHEVRVLADPSIEPQAKQLGCAFTSWTTAPHKHSLSADDDLLRDWEFKSLFALFRHVLDTFVCGPAAKFAADTIATLDAHPADVVLADFMLFGAQMAAEARGLPCVGLMPNISMRPTKGVPPIGPGFLPSRGPLGRIRDAMVRRVSARMWRRGLPPINAARAGLGLPPVDDMWSQHDRLAQLHIMTARAFDLLPPELPPNVHYVGPMLADPPWTASTWQSPWPDSTDPLVLVGLSSTYMHQGDLLQRIVDTLAQLPVRALVTLGPALPSDAVRSPTPNVVVVPTAPHGLILPHAALAITHCGHGTTIRALAAGVPLVCIPMGRDQNDTAARVVHRGAGVRLKPTSSAAAIKRAVETILGVGTYRENAKTLEAQIAHELTTIDPVALIEQLAPPRRASLMV